MFPLQGLSFVGAISFASFRNVWNSPPFKSYISPRGKNVPIRQNTRFPCENILWGLAVEEARGGDRMERPNASERLAMERSC